MKKVALHCADRRPSNSRRPVFPNLALMKLSTYHRWRGDEVSWFSPIGKFDIVYSSKVFTFSGNDPYLPKDAEKGGVGYGLFDKLDSVIEHCPPDYDLYGMGYSMGFISRGCIRDCSWCIVPEKEGGIHFVSEIEEFVRHGSVVLLDNNVLACERAYYEMEKLIQRGIRVDFNQGLDSRLIDMGVARMLARMEWIDFIRLACDSQGMKRPFERALGFMRKAGVRERFMCFCLVGDDLDEAHERVMFVRGLGVDPFAMAYRDVDPGYEIPWKTRAFCRWVNRKAIFYSVSWEEYRKENS